MLNGVFKKTSYIPLDMGRDNSVIEPSVPDGLWKKCPSCKKAIYNEDLNNNFKICPKCGYHFRMNAKERIGIISDEGTFEEWDEHIDNTNPLNFKGYVEKIDRMKNKTGLNEAVITGKCKINKMTAAIAVCDSNFMMGSMGYVVGEKITLMFERATKEKIPVIIFTCSGGARMQEGIISLMQMAKTSQAIKKHSEAGLLYITVITDPTTGGVTASFAMLGDIILGEPGALIGFAGSRVIEQTLGQKLPEGFQRTGFLLKKGFIDRIVERNDIKNILSKLLYMHTKKTASLRPPEYYNGRNFMSGIKTGMDKNKSPWEKVKISRDSKRCTAIDYINEIFKDFTEFHGDRCYGDDGAVIGGIATLAGIPVTVIGQQKGHNLRENQYRNFGMANPEGYRKALRLMKQAEKFNRPIICFADTPGAFCGIEAEERGQGQAIANNLFEMSALRVPIVTVMIGEGGSGGALALAVANEVWMLENATYSILSPEGFASILWKDSRRAEEAASVMKMTAQDLYKLKVIDRIIPEPSPASDTNLGLISRIIKNNLKEFLSLYMHMDKEEIVGRRYERFRNF